MTGNNAENQPDSSVKKKRPAQSEVHIQGKYGRQMRDSDPLKVSMFSFQIPGETWYMSLFPPGGGEGEREEKSSLYEKKRE